MPEHVGRATALLSGARNASSARGTVMSAWRSKWSWRGPPQGAAQRPTKTDETSSLGAVPLPGLEDVVPVTLPLGAGRRTACSGGPADGGRGGRRVHHPVHDPSVPGVSP